MKELINFLSGKNELNVILDTSGSLVGNDLDYIFSNIFQKDIKLSIIQCDFRIRKICKLENFNDFKNMKLFGGEGTILQSAVDYISNKNNDTVIITDGYTDDLDFSAVKTNTLIVSDTRKVTIKNDNGKVEQIICKPMEYEYMDEDWKMWLEGSSYYEPKDSEIIDNAKKRGFDLKNIDIWFDDLEHFWRFRADLVSIKK